MKTILIPGISGFTGRHFEQYVQKKKLMNSYRFVGCSRTLSNSLKSGSVEYRSCDLTNSEQIFNLVREIEPDYIFNATGIFGNKDFEELIRQNVIASKNLLDAVKTAGRKVEKIVLIGSAAEYGYPEQIPITEEHPANPVSFYGLSKLYQTELARTYANSFALPVLIARTFNITGDGISEQLSVGNFKSQINRADDGDVLKVGNLDSYRDFIPIEKAIEYYWTLLFKGSPGECYNVCSGVPTRMRDLLLEMIEESGKNLTFSTAKTLLKEVDVDIIYGSNEKLKSLI